MLNPFKVLDLPETATADEARARFRELVKGTHPDLGGGAIDGEWMARIKLARDTIIENSKKSGRDEPGRGKGSASGSKPKQSRPSPRRSDRRQSVVIPLSEALRGGLVRVNGSSGSCKRCSGSGHIRTQKRMSCASCGGTGVSATAQRGLLRIFAECGACSGTGSSTKMTCPDCDGYGSRSGVSGQVEVPPGTHDGDVFVIEGGASDRELDTIGDLEIVVKVDIPAGMRVKGDDLYCPFELDVADAALGGSVSFKAPNGISYTVTVPQGTETTDRLRLKGLGFAGDSGRGDIVLIPRIKVPDATDDRVRRAFEDIKRFSGR